MKDGRAGRSDLTERPILNELNLIVAEAQRPTSKHRSWCFVLRWQTISYAARFLNPSLVGALEGLPEYPQSSRVSSDFLRIHLNIPSDSCSPCPAICKRSAPHRTLPPSSSCASSPCGQNLATKWEQ